MSMYDLLPQSHQSGAQLWARLWSEGHGRTWLASAEYTRHHRALLRRVLTQSANLLLPRAAEESLASIPDCFW